MNSSSTFSSTIGNTPGAEILYLLPPLEVSIELLSLALVFSCDEESLSRCFVELHAVNGSVSSKTSTKSKASFLLMFQLLL